MAIFKSVAKRGDGGSSFASLVSYLARGGARNIDYEGRSPRGMIAADALRASPPRFDQPPLLFNEFRTLDQIPTLRDLSLFAGARGGVTQAHREGAAMSMQTAVPMETNCISLMTAAQEMRAVASMNTRVKDPVYHFLVSLQRGEQPPNSTMFEIARETIKALGFEAHQYAAAIHHDTDNLHVHVAVNRVHPETYRAVYPDRDHYKGARVMREIELRYGLAHDKGAFAVFERDGKTVIDWASKDPNTKEKAPTKARDMEVHGRESLFSYARGGPRRAVVEALKSPALTWCHGSP